MARHAAPASLSRRQSLLRAGLTVSAAGAVLGLAGGAAHADARQDAALGQSGGATAHALTGTAGNVVAPVTHLRLDPLAKTGVDPLANGVGTQVADFKPVSTTPLTSPITEGGALDTLPVTGGLSGLLTH